jgi:PAS domain-containing protein
LEFVRKDRTSLHALLSATTVKDKQTNDVASRWVLLDITERKRMQNAESEGEERLRRVFQEGPLSFALVGRDHGFLNVNNALCRMVGYEPRELTAMTFEDITHPEDRQAGAALAEQLFTRTSSPFRVPG